MNKTKFVWNKKLNNVCFLVWMMKKLGRQLARWAPWAVPCACAVATLWGLADQAGAQHEPVRGDLGLGGVLFERGDEAAGQAHWGFGSVD